MAKATAHGGKVGGEILHIVILTSFMTGGLLAILSAVFYLFVIPAREAQLADQVADYNKLLKLLDPKKASKESKEIWELRARHRQAKTASTATLREMVQEQLGDLGFQRFPPTATPAGGRGVGTVENIQAIDLKEAPLSQILQFVGRVKQANPRVEVSKMTLNRKIKPSIPGLGGAAPPPAPGDDDRWMANIEFYLAVTAGKTPAPAAPAAASAEAAGAGDLLDEKKG